MVPILISIACLMGFEAPLSWLESKSLPSSHYKDVVLSHFNTKAHHSLRLLGVLECFKWNFPYKAIGFDRAVSGAHFEIQLMLKGSLQKMRVGRTNIVPN